MVLQVLRLRVTAATSRFAGVTGRPEPPVQSYAASPAPRIAQGLAITRRVVESMIAESAARGARTAVVLMPARFQVDDADYGRLRQIVSEAGGELVRDGATIRFKEALRGIDAPVFDPLPAMRAALPGPDLFFQQTVHLTPRGHEIVADAVEQFFAAPVWSNRRRGSERAMVFNSLHFVWFFLVVYAAYRVLPHRAQNWLLLIASYYFYASWDWRFLGLLIASTLVDFSCARALDRTDSPTTRRALLVLSLGFNLTLLGFFKYFNFFADNLHTVFGSLGWRLDFVTLRVLLPVGISFYTFVTMSYVIDVYRRELPADAEPARFRGVRRVLPASRRRADSAGVTAPAPDRRGRERITRDQMRDGLWLIAWGFFQKIFVADNLAGIANLVFDPGAHHTGVNVLLGTYAFAFQIYGDFAGYSNVARGTSKLMGIELIENFRYPYLVRSAQDFWKHWHISLSTWLRDYLYIPLGGSRGSAWQTRRNLLITMVLGGLWHGAAWTFVLWGVYHGVLLIAYRGADRVSGPASVDQRVTASLRGSPRGR